MVNIPLLCHLDKQSVPQNSHCQQLLVTFKSLAICSVTLIMTEASQTSVSWGEILTREYASKIATLALAIWLHAASSMLTATTMPSAVEEIGGLNLIHWTFALYLMGSIIAGASVSLLVANSGIRKTMIQATLLYGIGSVICALAPSMPVVLIGRVLQGLGGGGLVSLVYISQDRFFPNRFVPKIVAFISLTWVISAFCGPMIGGAFATWGVWRMAYWAFALQALLLMLAIRLLLNEQAEDSDLKSERIPVVRLSFLATAILLVSMAGVGFDPLPTMVLVCLGCLMLVFFVVRDKAEDVGRMLPIDACNFTHELGNGVIMILLLCMCLMSFLIYGPLLLIKLYHLTPFVAGLIVMMETLAWGCSAIIFSGIRVHQEPSLIRAGSAFVVIGLIGMGIVFPRGPLSLIIVMAIVSSGGFGMMWGFIIKRVIAAAPADDKDRAASLLPITQQTGFALGAAFSGIIVSILGLGEDISDESLRTIAFWLFVSFVPIAILGNVSAWRFVRGG